MLGNFTIVFCVGLFFVCCFLKTTLAPLCLLEQLLQGVTGRKICSNIPAEVWLTTSMHVYTFMISLSGIDGTDLKWWVKRCLELFYELLKPVHIKAMFIFTLELCFFRDGGYRGTGTL